jgi:hypothetical protein
MYARQAIGTTNSAPLLRTLPLTVIHGLTRLLPCTCPDPLNPSISEYDLDEGKGKVNEQKQAHGGEDDRCTERLSI